MQGEIYVQTNLFPCLLTFGKEGTPGKRTGSYAYGIAVCFSYEGTRLAACGPFVNRRMVNARRRSITGCVDAAEKEEHVTEAGPRNAQVPPGGLTTVTFETQ